MTVSFNKLFKLLIDKNMRKGELISSAGIGSSSLAKLRKGQNVNVDVLVKVCRAMDCTFDDIMDIVPKEEAKKSSDEMIVCNEKNTLNDMTYKCQSCVLVN